MQLFRMATLRKFASRLAPVGTHRRAFVLWARSRYFRFRDPQPFTDPLSRQELERLFSPPRAQPIPAWPSDASPVRQLAAFLLAHPDLARQFPHTMDGDTEGAFTRWLESEDVSRLGIDRRTVERWLQVIAERPAVRPLHLYDSELYLRMVYPLGLTPAQLPALTSWMLRCRSHFGLSEEEILAFYLRWAVDPAGSIRACYLRQPTWQLAVPDGLTATGWPALLAWLRKRYRLCLSCEPPETLAEPDHTRTGVNVLGYFCYPCGLQIAAANTVAALRSSGLEVSCRNVPLKYQTDQPATDEVRGLHPYPVTISQLGPEPFGANGYDFAGLARRPETYRIGYWYWELDRTPARWKHHASWLSELWAPTRFIADALRTTMPMPVVDMLAGMEMPPHIDLPRSRFGLPEDRFLFLFAFDMCSIFERKNPLAAIEAFRRAFRPQEPVALAIKVSRGWHDVESLSRLASACIEAGVHLIDATLSHEEALGLMNACDAYVSLHRSEGFGLTMAEAMALGKPTIATAYSGNLDFMTPNNSLLVDYKLVPLTRTLSIYPRGSRWAEPSVEHAAAHLRWVYDHPASAQAMARRGEKEIRQTLSIEAAGQRMVSRLRELGFALPAGEDARADYRLVASEIAFPSTNRRQSGSASRNVRP